MKKFTVKLENHYFCNKKESECKRYNKDNDICCCGCGIAEEMRDKLGRYEEIEEKLEKEYGECDELLEKVANLLIDYRGKELKEHPEKVILISDEHAEKYIKWKKMEEQGKLLILPCKPEDTVYAYCKELHRILPYFVEQVVIDYDPDNTNGYVTINCNCVENNELIDCIDFEPKEVGIKVFLTEQEAKEALEEMKNGD